MNQVIAERKLFYFAKGSDIQKKLIVCVGAPFIEKEHAVCSIKFDGLPIGDRDVRGMDGIQALELAVKVIESTLIGLKNEYNFYFQDGASYFDDEDS